jgi:hypothetical protein
LSRPGSSSHGSSSRPPTGRLRPEAKASSVRYSNMMPRAAPVSTPSREMRRPSFLRVAASANSLNPEAMV